MRAIAKLRAPVDAFFDKVTVNADDPSFRENRLRLLNRDPGCHFGEWPTLPELRGRDDDGGSAMGVSLRRRDGRGAMPAMRNLLGGKGANLAEMANLGLPVPPGFTITTEVCTDFYAIGRSAIRTGSSAEVRAGARGDRRGGRDEFRRCRASRCSSRCARARASRCRA